MSKFCRNCGTPLADGEKFCSNCGTPAGNVSSADETTHPKPQNTPPDGQAQGVDWKQFVPKVSVGKPQVRVNKKGLIAFAIFILVVFVIKLIV